MGHSEYTIGTLIESDGTIIPNVIYMPDGGGLGFGYNPLCLEGYELKKEKHTVHGIYKGDIFVPDVPKKIAYVF